MLDKKYFEEFAKYSNEKLKHNWFKKLFMAIFGGLFIGLGYIGYLLVTGANVGIEPIWLKLIGALIFPLGLLLCMYLGGSLFTSSCINIISVLYKDHKMRHYILDLTLILIGNIIGTFVFALIVWSSNLFGAIGDNAINHAGINLINDMLNKINDSHQWWSNLMSAILCNFIVVGSIIVGIKTKKSGAGVFIIYLLLIVFVIAGLQHIVANSFLFSLGGFLSLHKTSIHLNSTEVGQIFYQNLIPTLAGNWIGGWLLTMLYLSGQCYIYKGKFRNKKLDETQKIEIAESN